MSFSSDVKRELCGIWPDRPCCRAAQLYGMLEGGRSFSREKITLQTEHRPVADLFERLLLDVTGAAAVIAESEGKFRSLSVSPADCRRIWERYGHDAASFAVRLNHANLECDECAAAYLRG
ncbi:MAG: hypothetical protein ACOYJY_08365, partial [Acutalibacteraceae bacterium]